MGIRIHKVLGYGLDDVKYDKEKWKIDDHRINTKAAFIGGDDKEDDYSKYTSEGYIEWLKENATGKFHFDIALNLKSRQDQIHDCIHYDPEYGESNVLVFRPLSCPDWSRYDDSIDYAQSAYLSEQVCGNSVGLINEGLYPWIGEYMDKRTGETLDKKIMWWIRSKNDNADDIHHLDALAECFGFKDHKEALENVRPTIPEPIIDLCRYLNIFNDEKYIRQLRPMIYTYWS